MISGFKKLLERDALWYCLIALGLGGLFLPAYSGFLGIFHDDIGMASFTRLFFIARSLQSGHIPLWDPHTWCGAIPFYARYFAETYYFILWPFYLLADLGNAKSAFNTLLVLPLYLHFCAAGWGLFVFLRRIVGFKAFGAFCAALLFVLSPVFAYAHSWEQVVYHHCWIPWLMFVFCRLCEKWNWRFVAWGGVFFALILLSANPSNWHFVFFLFGGTVALKTLFVPTFADARIRKRALCGAGAIVLLGAGISTVYLFGFAGAKFYMQEHIELTAQAAIAEKFSSLPLSYLATLFVPDIFGNVTGTGLLERTIAPEVVLFWEANLLGGMIVSFFVFCGMYVCLAMPAGGDEKHYGKRLWLRAFFALFVFGVLCSLGRYSFFYKLIIGHIPGISAMPRPIRYRFLQCFAGAVLAGAGVELLLGMAGDWFKRAKIKKLVAIYLAFTAVAVFGVLAWPLGHVTQIRYEWNRPVEADGGFGPVSRLLPVGSVAGNFSPPNPSVEFRFCTTGAGSGQIRWNEKKTDSASGGSLLGRYQCDKPGWGSVKVDVPAGVFVWLVPDDDSGQLEVRAHKNNPTAGVVFNEQKKEWENIPDAQILVFRQKVLTQRMSVWEKLQLPVKGKLMFVFLLVLGGGLVCFGILIRMLFGKGLFAGKLVLRVAVAGIGLFCTVLFGYFFVGNTLYDLSRSHQKLPPLLEQLNYRVNSNPDERVFEWNDATIFAEGGGMVGPESLSAPGVGVCNYSPPRVVDKLAVWFDGKCSGRIISAKQLEDGGFEKGRLVREFKTDHGGWNIFDVNIEPSRFVAVVPDQPDVRTGVRKFPYDGFVLPYSQSAWKEIPGASMLYFGQDKSCVPPAPKPYTAPQALFKSMLYFLASCAVLAFLFVPKPVVCRFMCAVLLGEAFLWSFCAFYASSFSLGQLYPSQLRARGADHSIFNAVTTLCEQKMQDPMFLTATTMPFYDNFFRVTGSNAFMGYEMHPMESRFKTALEKALAMPLDYKIYYQLVRLPRALLNFYSNFSVKYLLDSSSVAVFENGEISPLKGFDGLFVNTNPKASPRLRFAHKALSVPDAAQLDVLLGRDLDGVAMFLPEDYARISALLPANMSGRVLGADFADANRVECKVDTDSGGVLVLTDVWFPGWKVYLDGKRVDLYRVNYCQRGVFVPAGKHSVEFVFAPVLWTAGMIVSVVCLGLVLVLFVMGRGDGK